MPEITKELLEKMLHKEMEPIKGGFISSTRGEKKGRADILCELLDLLTNKLEDIRDVPEEDW